MIRWLANQYARRIVNINVNIFIASMAAITLTAIPLHLSRYVGVTNEHKITILIITLVSDWIIDLVIAVGLHWLANHWPQRWQRTRKLVDKADRVIDAAPPPVSFIKDATIIQLQRLCLSPLFYGIAMYTQWLLMHEGLAREVSAFLGFLLAVIVTRILHTLWLLRSERTTFEQWEAMKAARGHNNPPRPTPAPPGSPAPRSPASTNAPRS